MTLGAAPVEETTDFLRIIGSVAGVTLGTEPRHAIFKQAVIVAAVRFMAIGAIIRNRRMLKKVGPSSLRMASVAVFVNAGLFKLRRIWRAVRIVAIGACDFPFPERHVRGAHELGFAL